MRLRAGRRELDLAGPPLLMGVVNATPDSFSDAGELPDLDARVARAAAHVAAGAAIVDVGGESAVGLRPPVAAAEEIERVVPVIERIVAEHDVLVSVDTYKPEVAEAAIAAGAGMVNDVSGLRDPALADVCARTGAALVVMHTRVDAEGDAARSRHLRRRGRGRRRLPRRAGRGRALARGGGVADRARPRARTSPRRRRRRSRCCAGSTPCCALGHPVLLAVSRKDFLGAITGRAARDRGAATLAALAAGVDAGASILRVHDVAAAADFLAVRAVLRGDRELAPDEGLTPDRFPER